MQRRFGSRESDRAIGARRRQDCHGDRRSCVGARFLVAPVGGIRSLGRKRMFEHCTWLNEPADWRRDGGTLYVRTDLKTDFWRETHYRFVRHGGHVFGYRTAGDFTASIRVRAAFRELYDQAGIMVLL